MHKAVHESSHNSLNLLLLYIYSSSVYSSNALWISMKAIMPFYNAHSSACMNHRAPAFSSFMTLCGSSVLQPGQLHLGLLNPGTTRSRPFIALHFSVTKHCYNVGDITKEKSAKMTTMCLAILYLLNKFSKRSPSQECSKRSPTIGQGRRVLCTCQVVPTSVSHDWAPAACAPLVSLAEKLR